MGDSSIEWTDKTWNPLAGCALVSEGCRRCYAARQAATRLAHLPAYQGLATKEPGKPALFTGEVRLLPDRLGQPLAWRGPHRVFVNSMSDLFHKDVPDGYIMRVFDVMAQCPQHTFQVLTKRPGRMAAWTQRWADREGEPPGPQLARGPAEHRAIFSSGRGTLFADMLDSMGPPPPDCAYPTYDWMEGMRWWLDVLPNVAWGTSIENDAYAYRANQLRKVVGAMRFLSMEPLLGAVPSLNLDGIGWVIVGGESGHGARPMHPAWVRQIRDMCLAAKVPFFLKQWGEWVPETERPPGVPLSPTAFHSRSFVDLAGQDRYSKESAAMFRVGKKAAGALLDGREWREFPRGF